MSVRRRWSARRGFAVATATTLTNEPWRCHYPIGHAISQCGDPARQNRSQSAAARPRQRRQPRPRVFHVAPNVKTGAPLGEGAPVMVLQFEARGRNHSRHKLCRRLGFQIGEGMVT
jgi:hypothetical protein